MERASQGRRRALCQGILDPDLRHGISFDQAAAKARGHLIPLLSLELGVTPRAILGSESEAEHGSSGRVRACLLDAASVAWQRWLLREYLVVSLSG